MKSQRGFTLSEVLIVIAITGMIIGAITAVFFQVFNSNARSTNHMTAIKEVENAINQITRDAQMAQTVVKTTASGFPLQLEWVDWDSTAYKVTYRVQNGQLKRSYSKTPLIDPPFTSNTVLIPNLDTDLQPPNCQYSPGKLDFTITATIGGLRPASETRSFEVVLRSAP
jgi:prepilin-type N-terminal cleavage/methylation domain-containing protein